MKEETKSILHGVGGGVVVFLVAGVMTNFDPKIVFICMVFIVALIFAALACEFTPKN